MTGSSKHHPRGRRERFPPAPPSPTGTKVVFHLSRPDPEDYRHALANVENLLADGTVDAEAVALAAFGRSPERGPRLFAGRPSPLASGGARFARAAHRSDLALVTTGDAVRALLADAPHADRVAALAERDVEVVACGNSLRSRDLTGEDLQEGVEVGSSGVGELARRQADGYLKVP